MAIKVDIIETKRLVLRGINEVDAEFIVKWRSDPDVYKFFKFPHKIDMEEHLAWYNTKYLSDENRFDWICIEKESKNRIGVFGLRKDNDRVEISYLLSTESQHKGYASEVLKSLLEYVSGSLNVKQVIAEIHDKNKASIALVKKLGFKELSHEGPFVIYGIEV